MSPQLCGASSTLVHHSNIFPLISQAVHTTPHTSRNQHNTPTRSTNGNRTTRTLQMTRTSRKQFTTAHGIKVDAKHREKHGADRGRSRIPSPRVQKPRGRCVAKRRGYWQRDTSRKYSRTTTESTYTHIQSVGAFGVPVQGHPHVAITSLPPTLHCIHA